MGKAARVHDVLIVGGGPAGIAAAVCASQGSGLVTVVDDNPKMGGQIWRDDISKAHGRVATEWFKKLAETNVEFLRGARIVDNPEPGLLTAEDLQGNLHHLQFRKLVLATGARERFLPFPGWTLPNVVGAGGLQALVKSGLSVTRKRVVIAGSGPLLLAVAQYLKQHGARVLLVAEQTSRGRIARFAFGLAAHPAKAVQAIRMKANLIGVQYLTGCWPTKAEGDGKVTRVHLRRGNRAWTIECDYLACGFGLVSNPELGALMGLDISDGAISVDEFQRTSLADIYCAGESTGIGGLELSLVEGEIAGYAAAGMESGAKHLFPKRARHLAFARLLNRTFELNSELRNLAQDDTIFCRCEDVTTKRVREHGNWRSAKLMTRCGMGPCQGRICGPAAEFLYGWNIESSRPPLFPATLKNLAGGAPADSGK